jgi:hypothetical protein
MKKVVSGITALFIASVVFAQQPSEEITKKNSWLKAGVNAGVPVGDISTYSAFAAGIDISGQFMVTKNFGLGVASGYTHFFPKSNYDNFGIIPVGLLMRYYPKSEGFFAGADVGYAFITNTNNSDGGLYLKPQLGYHNYSWNLYGFYNHVFRNDNLLDVQTVGVAATYNIRFR